MHPEDISRVLCILNEAAEGEVSASSLEIYAREACAAASEDQIALVAEASLSSSPLDSPTTEVVGLVGLLLADDLKPAEMKLDGTSTGYVTNLAVDSKWRGGGVGTALLLAVEDAARRAACAEVACRVDENNVVARAMYEHRGYGAIEPKRLVAFRTLMGHLYGIAGVAHAADLLAGPSTLPALAGAPAFASMDATQKALALVWCALGPLAAAAGSAGSPKIAEAGLVVYGAYEVGLAASCAAAFGAVGGDAVTSATAVQVVVFGCYQWLSPTRSSSSRGRLSLGKHLGGRGRAPQNA